MLSFYRLLRFRLNDMGNRKKLESEDRTRKKILNEFLRSMKTKKLILILFFSPYFSLSPNDCAKAIGCREVVIRSISSLIL